MITASMDSLAELNFQARVGLRREQINDKQTLGEAWLFFLKYACFGLEQVCSQHRTASVGQTFEKQFLDFATRYRIWYGEIFQLAQEIVRASYDSNLDLRQNLESLLITFQEEEVYKDIVEKLKLFERGASFSLQIYENNLSEKDKRSSTIQAAHKDIKAAREKLRSPEAFFQRLIQNIIFLEDRK